MVYTSLNSPIYNHLKVQCHYTYFPCKPDTEQLLECCIDFMLVALCMLVHHETAASNQPTQYNTLTLTYNMNKQYNCLTLILPLCKESINLCLTHQLTVLFSEQSVDSDIELQSVYGILPCRIRVYIHHLNTIKIWNWNIAISNFKGSHCIFAVCHSTASLTMQAEQEEPKSNKLFLVLYQCKTGP